MPRTCGPCGDTRRKELDRRLLEKEFSGESYRRISADFGYSETALRRHLAEHLVVSLRSVQLAKEEAKKEALAKIKANELEVIKAEVKEDVSGRLVVSESCLDQVKELRLKAKELLDRAETADDLRASGVFLRELREQLRLWAELEGRLATQPQVNILVNPQWVELRTVIIKALEPYQDAREAVIHAIRE